LNRLDRTHRIGKVAPSDLRRPATSVAIAAVVARSRPAKERCRIRRTDLYVVFFTRSSHTRTRDRSWRRRIWLPYLPRRRPSSTCCRGRRSNNGPWTPPPTHSELRLAQPRWASHRSPPLWRRRRPQGEATISCDPVRRLRDRIAFKAHDVVLPWRGGAVRPMRSSTPGCQPIRESSRRRRARGRHGRRSVGTPGRDDRDGTRTRTDRAWTPHVPTCRPRTRGRPDARHRASRGVGIERMSDRCT
jgi:hypothetical protein